MRAVAQPGEPASLEDEARRAIAAARAGIYADAAIVAMLEDPRLDTSIFADRLSMSTGLRIFAATGVAASIGFFLGSVRGSKTSALRFRAENAHRLPISQQGWYLYHKSKNYMVIRAGAAEALRMSARVSFWACAFTTFEASLDFARSKWHLDKMVQDHVRSKRPLDASLLTNIGRDEFGRRRLQGDALSTLGAGMATGGLFGALHRMPGATIARMAKLGGLSGLALGVVQDVLAVARGHRVVYIDWAARRLGFAPPGTRRAKDEEEKAGS